jgi:microcin C transport system substrate-binding protein
MADIGSFDSLNPILYKGEPAAGLGLVYESLMQDSLEEASTSYGLIAEWASYPPDFSSVTFKLRDEADWNDGTPITPEDVVYSLEVNKAANPRMALYYKNVAKAGNRANQVTFTFDVKAIAAPMIMTQLTVLPKHYWTGRRQGQISDRWRRRSSAARALAPTASNRRPRRGPSLTSAWPTMGQGSAGEPRAMELRRDPQRLLSRRDGRLRASRRAISTITGAGARQNWATTATRRGARWIVQRQEVPIERATGAVLRAQYPPPAIQDRRVRRAFNLAYDFEWANKKPVLRTIRPSRQLLQGSEAHRPRPARAQLEILTGEGWVPPEVFARCTKSGEQQFRRHAQQSPQAVRLLKSRHEVREACW